MTLSYCQKSALLRRFTLKNNDDYYCMNCLHPFRTKNKLKLHENVCKNHDYCYIKLPKKDNNILHIYTIYIDMIKEKNL